MTKNGNLKREIRARAEKTGESYTAARRHVVGDSGSERTRPLAPLRVAVAQMAVHVVQRMRTCFELPATKSVS